MKILPIILIVMLVCYMAGVYSHAYLAPVQLQGSAVPSPTPDLSYRGVNPLHFSRFAQDASSIVTKEFRDPLLGVSFRYPSSYHMTAAMSTRESATAQLFFLSTYSRERAQHLQGVLDCREEDEVGSLCSEGQVSDVDVYINAHPNPADWSDEDSCIEEQLDAAPDLRIFSCLTNGISGKVEYRYIADLMTERNYVELSADAGQDPYEVGELLWTMISTFSAL